MIGVWYLARGRFVPHLPSVKVAVFTEVLLGKLCSVAKKNCFYTPLFVRKELNLLNEIILVLEAMPVRGTGIITQVVSRVPPVVF